MNEPSTKTTFVNRIGKSNLDLTLATSYVLRRITDWSISDEESNSDHSIISNAIKTGNNHKNNTNTEERKFRVNSVNTEKNKENIHRTVENIIWERSKENGEDDLDTRLYERTLKDNQTEKNRRLQRGNENSCEQSFKTKKARKAPHKNKSVPWWTHELTAARKITNNLSRMYQRTRDNAEQTERNKVPHFAQKAKYSATINREKTKPWKEYCNLTTEANPWNSVYRLASGKKRTNTQITTFRKQGDSLTSDTKETLRLMLEYFTPEANELDDNNHHKYIRELTVKQPYTSDDREFTRE